MKSKTSPVFGAKAKKPRFDSTGHCNIIVNTLNLSEDDDNAGKTSYEGRFETDHFAAIARGSIA